METTEPAYFAAYPGLKMTRDVHGVLVIEFDSHGGPLRFTAEDHTDFVDAFYLIARDRANQIVILAGTAGQFIPEIDFSSFGNVADFDVWGRVRDEEATFQDLPHFAGGIVPGDGIFAMGSYRAGAGRTEAFLLNPQPLSAHTAYERGVVAEVVPDGRALARAQELAALYLKAPEVMRRNTRTHFIQPLKERIVREVGYGLSLEGSSLAALAKSIEATS